MKLQIEMPMANNKLIILTHISNHVVKVRKKNSIKVSGTSELYGIDYIFRYFLRYSSRVKHKWYKEGEPFLLLSGSVKFALGSRQGSIIACSGSCDFVLFSRE